MESKLILVLGKNEIVREGLRRILVDQFFTVESMTPEQATSTEISSEYEPHLIIVDGASNAESIETCRVVHERYPGARLVLMGENHGIDHIAAAFAVGVAGYLIKAIPCEPLVGSIKLILMGEKVVPSQTVDALVDPRSRFTCGDREAMRAGANLSEREVEILECLILGEANKLISRRFMITEATVKVHVKAILRKVRVQNRTQAAIWGVNRGLLQADRRELQRTP